MIATVPLKVADAISLALILLSSPIPFQMVKPDQPTFTFEDTGLLDNDAITNNSVITVSGLEVGATWQYQSLLL
jgi:hypothetical protein